MSRLILEGVFAQIVYNGGDVNYTIGLLWALNEIILQYHQPLLNGVSCTLISCYYDLGFLSSVLGSKVSSLVHLLLYPLTLVEVLGAECGGRRGGRENVDLGVLTLCKTIP